MMIKIFIITVWIMFIYVLVLVPIAGGLVARGLIDPKVIEYMFGLLMTGIGVVSIAGLGYLLAVVTKEKWNDH